jgi:hypothetical protein
MATDKFLTDWANNTEQSTTHPHRRVFMGCEIVLQESGRSNTVRLSALRAQEPRKGAGTKFLKWLGKQADKHGFDLTMAAQPWGHSFEPLPSKEKVLEIARKTGFEIQWQYPDQQGWEMVRYPN